MNKKSLYKRMSTEKFLHNLKAVIWEELEENLNDANEYYGVKKETYIKLEKQVYAFDNVKSLQEWYQEAYCGDDTEQLIDMLMCASVKL